MRPTINHTLLLGICCFAAWFDGPRAIGQENLTELLGKLTSDDAQVRRQAAESLSKIRPLDEAAIPALVKALDDDSVSPYAARALAHAGPKAGDAVKPRLLERLRAKDVTSATRNEVHSLYGAALPALCEMLKEAEPLQRENTLITLRNMGQAALPAAPAVKQSMTDRDTGVRLAAAGCYWSLTGNTQDTIPILLDGLQAPVLQSAHWCEAARTLGQIGPPAKSAVPPLVEVLVGSRETTAGLKIYVGPAFPWYHVRSEAAIALGRIGPDAKEAIEPLIAASRQANHRNSDAGLLRVRAARALWLIAPDHPEALPAVLRGLKERYPLDRIATETVMAVGSPAKDAVRDLIAALASERLDTRQAAIDALGMVGAPASEAIPALQGIARLKEQQALRAAEHAQLAIVRIGPPEQSAVPLMKLIAKSALDDEVRRILGRRLAEPE